MIYRVLILLIIMIGCNSEYQQMSGVLQSIIDSELNNEIIDDKENYIFFLQNAKCKCSEQTLEEIENLSQIFDNNVVVVINNRNHFSLQSLRNAKTKVKYLSVNTLISYGFIQDKDILVWLNKEKLNYKLLE